ncbi:MAG: hypothetical protein L0221_14285 [Chloroflexi bacterium]|nr:hypothetical protein [Chloroflexota bacterium]
MKLSDWMLEGCDPGRWRLPDAADPDAERVLKNVVRGLALGEGDREIFASRLHQIDRYDNRYDESPWLAPGETKTLVAEFVMPARVLALVLDEPAGLDVRSVRLDMCELVIDAVPASLFAATQCAECRDRACQAFVGKRWPRVMPGQRAQIEVLNASEIGRVVRAVFVCQKEDLPGLALT